MKKLPEWLKNLAKKYKCPRCGDQIKINKIIGIGIKESHTGKGKDVLFFEYFCEKCDDVYIFEVDFAPTDELLASMSDYDVENEDSIIKSGIKDREVTELKKFLKSCKCYEDFLIEVGVSKSDIEKYGKYVNKKGK